MIELEGTFYCDAPKCKESAMGFMQHDMAGKTIRVVSPPEVPQWTILTNGSLYCPVCAQKYNTMQMQIALQQNGGNKTQQ